jgi:S1-C subfamily serine protease
MEQAVPREDMGSRANRGNRRGDPNRLRLGVFLGDGMQIDDLVDDGLAAKSGMTKGDVLVSINGKAISGMSDVSAALKSVENKVAKVVWKRGDKLMAATFNWKDKTAKSAKVK